MLTQVKKITVIVGCQRSGTTLIGQIIGAHPKAMLIDEPDGLYNWFKNIDKAKAQTGHIARKLLQSADNKYRPQTKRLIKLDDNKRLKPNVDHLVLKAPNLTYSLETLKRLEQDIRIIYPIRDPRSVVASISKLKQVNMVDNQIKWINEQAGIKKLISEDFEQLSNPDLAIHIRRAYMWKIKSGLFEQFEQSGLKPLVLKYEDLIADTERMCHQITHHLDIPFHDNMMRHGNIFRGIGPGFTERSRPVDNISIRKWANRLNPKQQRDVMEVAGDLAVQFGYTQDNCNKISRSSFSISDEIINGPIVLTGRGGSGTRLISEIAQSAKVFLGNRLNACGDSTEWVDIIYELGIARARAELRNRPYQFGKGQLLQEKAQDVLGYGNWADNQLWGWKLPETMIAVPDVMSSFPNARLVHLIRSPISSSLRRTHMTSRLDNAIGRAVLRASYQSAGRDFQQISRDPDYIRNALTWQYQVGKVHQFANENLNPDNYHLIKFEDMIDRPETTTQNLLSFITGQSHDTSLPTIDQGRATNFEASDPRIDEVWELCGELAVQLGYKRP